MGSIQVLLTLSTSTNSPSCNAWSGSSWQDMPDAMTTSYRASGAGVLCTVDATGSFAIVDQCNPDTTCSGNGVCNFDGTCKCKLGMTGTNCATPYCDDVLFPCMNGGECVCNAEPYDCFSECVAEAGCEDACRAKCPSGSTTQYT